MKKILILILFLTVISGCRKVNLPEPMIDLGRESTSTKINKVYPVISDGKSVTLDMSLTAGSKYSLQVTDLLDNEIKTFGFTSDNSSYSKTLDLSTLKNGDYNVVLIDTKGNEIKINIIIKK